MLLADSRERGTSSGRFSERLSAFCDIFSLFFFIYNKNRKSTHPLDGLTSRPGAKDGHKQGNKVNPISDPRVRFWDADFRPQEGGHLFGQYLQCKIKKNGLKK